MHVLNAMREQDAADQHFFVQAAPGSRTGSRPSTNRRKIGQHKHHPAVNPNRKLMQAVRGLPPAMREYNQSAPQYKQDSIQETSRHPQHFEGVNDSILQPYTQTNRGSRAEHDQHTITENSVMDQRFSQI